MRLFEQKQVPALTIEKGQGLNDFTISLNSTNETFKVSSFGEKSKLYKTESGSYILDYAGNNVGDIPEDPILLINEIVNRGKITQSLHSFKYEPTGSVANENGNVVVFTIKIRKEIGLKISLIKMEYLKDTNSLNSMSY